MTDQAGPEDDVCTRPTHFRSTHPTTCGRKAVARLPIGMSGQLTMIYACAECKAMLDKMFPGEHDRWIPL